MTKTKAMKRFEVYEKPDGKWGWFHFYNPVNDTFAHQDMYDDGILIDNLWVWDYQQFALKEIFGDKYENIKETKLLEDINCKISKIYDLINTDDELKRIGCSDVDEFVTAFYVLVRDYKEFSIRILPRKKLAGLFILLIMDCLMRDCKYKMIEHIIFATSRFDKILKILRPDFDFEKEIFIEAGKKNGEKKRKQVISDYKTMGDGFWEKETKYDGKINLLMTRYNVCERTAKGYYSMLPK